jgi:predicted nucleic acid-binding protein
MIFIDSSVPMYLIGASHRHKLDAQRALERLVSARERLVTDAEVLQEIMHRYTALNRRDAIQPAFEALLRVTDEVLPIDREAVEKARSIVLARPSLSARAAIHLAVMRMHGIAQILTFDGGFERLPGVVWLNS